MATPREVMVKVHESKVFEGAVNKFLIVWQDLEVFILSDALRGSASARQVVTAAEAFAKSSDYVNFEGWLVAVQSWVTVKAAESGAGWVWEGTPSQ